MLISLSEGELVLPDGWGSSGCVASWLHPLLAHSTVVQAVVWVEKSQPHPNQAISRFSVDGFWHRYRQRKIHPPLDGWLLGM